MHGEGKSNKGGAQTFAFSPQSIHFIHNYDKHQTLTTEFEIHISVFMKNQQIHRFLTVYYLYMFRHIRVIISELFRAC
jgi:hypothetical protein